MEKIALVLCGGGGKGAFQIGVWKNLEKHNIMQRIKAISGTSVGALNAVLFALGDIALAEDIWKSVCPDDMLSLDINNFDCLFSRDGLKRILHRVPLERLKSCGIDVFVTLRNITLNCIEYKCINNLPRQEIEQILLASSAIPVAYPEVTIDGYRYGDAGAIEIYNTPIHPIYENGFRNIYIISLNYSFDRCKIFNGTSYIDADNEYAGTKFTVIRPIRNIGGIFKGTLNFRQGKIRTLICLGEFDSNLIIEGRKYINMANSFLKPETYVYLNKELSTLISENFHTDEELRTFVNMSGLRKHHRVLNTKNGGKIHWAPIVRVGNIEVQQHTALGMAWNHYRFVESQTDPVSGKKKKMCIFFTFDVGELLLELEMYLDKR